MVGGAGKTTLLRALLGLEPTVGTLYYGPRNLSAAGVGPWERPFAWVPQDAPLVTDDLIGNVALLGHDRESAERALQAVDGGALLARVGGALVGPGGRALSGGERRVVALARALATDLPVLLLDEPCAGLDAEATAQVLNALARIRAQRMLLLVTHEPAVAALADRCIPIGSAQPAALSEPAA
jgi:ABC-type transport system involved in cytochrome bd biosynthesis fused ATPase/permease subunit